MNELIQKLAREAGFYANSDIEKFEKFAELIVKECIDIVEGLSPGYQDYRNQIEDAFCRDCVAKIKYEFGVKE